MTATALDKLKEEASQPDLWSDQDRARAVSQAIARHSQAIGRVEELQSLIDDAEVLLDLAEEALRKRNAKEMKSLTRDEVRARAEQVLDRNPNLYEIARKRHQELEELRTALLGKDEGR